MQPRKLMLRRIFQAPPEEVFKAFVSAEALKEWWSPEGHVAIEAQVDVRVGGQYTLVMRSQTGPDIVHVHGVYREITPPNRLVFTHMFEHRGGADLFARVGLAGHQTLVTVDFHPWGDGTELVLVQEQIPTSAAEEMLQGGWQGIFNKLGRYLGQAAGGKPRNA